VFRQKQEDGHAPQEQGASRGKGLLIIRRYAKRLLWLLFFPAGILIFYISSALPHVTETVYSGRIYRGIRSAQSFVTGWAWFSIAEILVCATCVYVLVRLGMTVYRCTRKAVPDAPADTGQSVPRKHEWLGVLKKNSRRKAPPAGRQAWISILLEF